MVTKEGYDSFAEIYDKFWGERSFAFVPLIYLQWPTSPPKRQCVTTCFFDRGCFCPIVAALHCYTSKLGN